MVDAERFWSRVDRNGECWLWLRSCNKDGYGQVHVGTSRRDRAMWLAHRVAWHLEVGVIPEGLCVLHRCDNPPCVNPAHLFLGTNADNLADMTAKGRRWAHPKRTHCPKGHPYSGDNLIVRPGTGGSACRTCMRQWWRDHQRRKMGVEQGRMDWDGGDRLVTRG